jgi:hypothetical protein
MRTDFPADLMLLVKIDAEAFDGVVQKIKALPSVVSTEENQGGFSIR